MDIEVKQAEIKEGEIFGKHEEDAIISLAFDQPDIFSSVIQYLKSDYFQQFHTRFVFDIILYHWRTHEVILSRNMAVDVASQQLTADDPYQEVLDVIGRESDPREVPIIIEKLTEWARKKAIMQLYEQNTIDAVDGGDIERVEQIIEESRRITSVSNQYHFFFNELEPLFIKEQQEKFTTGFSWLDVRLNEGGPTRGDVFCFMAPTGVGKSLALANAAVANIKRSYNTLYVTLEMTWKQIATRFASCFTNIAVRERFAKKDRMMKVLSSIKSTYDSELLIAEFPPDEISSDNIHALVDMIRKIHGIKLDVVVIDYLELLMSRHPENNKDEYIRQKRTCTELDRLAKKESLFVMSATQTNRSGNEGQAKEQVIDLTKAAESYGKTMPMSYLVTINQTTSEYEGGRDMNGFITSAEARLYIAKNRNGPKFETGKVRIDYETMRMLEFESLAKVSVRN